MERIEPKREQVDVIRASLLFKSTSLRQSVHIQSYCSRISF